MSRNRNPFSNTMKTPVNAVRAIIVATLCAVALCAPPLHADTYDVVSGATQTLSGVTETSATVKTGAGTLVLEGNNSLKRFQPQAGTTVFSGGTTTVGDSTATAATAAGAPWGQTGGDTVVTGGATVTITAGTYGIMDEGTLTIANGTLDASKVGHFMNAFETGKTSTGSRIVIGNGGVLKAGCLRPSGEGANNAAFKEKVGVDLNAGGKLYVGQFWADQNASRYGRINFNGGVLYPTWGPNSTQTGNFLFNGDETRRPWAQDQITPTILEGGAFIDLSIGNNFVNKSFASGAANDGGLHILGSKILYWYAKNSTFNGGLWLESGNGAIFALDGSKANDTALGAVPAAPATNIWVTGSNHTLYNEAGTFAIHPNRTTFIKDGRRLYLGTKGRLVFGGEIHGEIAGGNADPTGTAIHVRGDWSGAIALDPGAGRTNDFGRLVSYGRTEITSGVTRVTSATDAGTSQETALVFVSGNGTAFTANRGKLAVNGGTLYAPPAVGIRYLVAQQYAGVSISNGGVIDMPGATLVNGLGTPATFSVECGTVCVTNFQIANGTLDDGVPSVVNFNADGFLATSELWSRATSLATVNFNGGGIRSWGKDVNVGSTDGAYANVTMLVKEGGAKFDAGSNIWLYHPLLSGAENDGGVTKTGSGTFIVRVAGSTYNGPTKIEGGSFQSRVDDGLPAGSTLVLANNRDVNFCKYDKYVNGSFWTSTRTEQHLGRLEGNGRVSYSSKLHVDGAIAPSIGGSIRLQEACDLQGDLEIRGEATGCGSLAALAEVNYRIDISKLRVKMVNPDTFDKNAEPGFYKILDAPNGFAGRFVEPADVAEGWHVRYAADGKSAYLTHSRPFTLIVR